MDEMKLEKMYEMVSEMYSDFIMQKEKEKYNSRYDIMVTFYFKCLDEEEKEKHCLRTYNFSNFPRNGIFDAKLFKDFKETEIVPDQIHIDIAYACIKDHYIFVEYEKYCKMDYFIGGIRAFSEQKECPNITYRDATA